MNADKGHGRQFFPSLMASISVHRRFNTLRNNAHRPGRRSEQSLCPFIIPLMPNSGRGPTPSYTGASFRLLAALQNR